MRIRTNTTHWISVYHEINDKSVGELMWEFTDALWDRLLMKPIVDNMKILHKLTRRVSPKSLYIAALSDSTLLQDTRKEYQSS